LKWFLFEAVPLFIFGSFIIFLMDKCYLLDLIKEAQFPYFFQVEPSLRRDMIRISV